MFGEIGKNYDMLWQAIIRPPRATYTADELGPNLIVVKEQREFHEGKAMKMKVKRTDMEIVNKQGLKLCCSHYQPVDRVQEVLPCVIYLHANSSCRLQAKNCLSTLMFSNITVFCFDFAGCGNSEGKYVSLGYYQRDDVEVVVDYLRKTNRVSTIGLWGRSMGAVTALMYADRDPSIAGLVLDSPFSNLQELARQLASKHSKVPGFLVGAALSMISNTIQKEHKFKISALNPLQHVKKAFIPAFFIVGKDDDFIAPHHTQKLYDAYAGQKCIKIVESNISVQGHNSVRPKYIRDSIGIFLFNTLQVTALVKCESPTVKPAEKSFEGYSDLSTKHSYKQMEFGQEAGLSQQEMLQLAIQRSMEQHKK